MNSILVTRRSFFARSAVGACALCNLGTAVAQQHVQGRGCTIQGGEMERLVTGAGVTWTGLRVDDPVIAVSGNTGFDRALGRQLVRLSRSFGVRPGFAYADDFRGENAVASNHTRFPNTQGTVLMGVRFMRNVLLRGEGGDIALMGVCAHEFGHVTQFFNGTHEWLSAHHPTSKLVELHADFLAGCFVGETRRARPSIITRTFEEVFHAMGSFTYADPFFHGTPAERLEAVRAGQRAAERGLSFQASSQEGVRHVLATFR